mmetsp:Transcript_49817/g.97451  ORF Transcript_49817/g.97451 Transcript_49817/m.97451 type:complete len:278 (+) Transcript_49817:284-1117(+)
MDTVQTGTHLFDLFVLDVISSGRQHWCRSCSPPDGAAVALTPGVYCRGPPPHVSRPLEDWIRSVVRIRRCDGHSRRPGDLQRGGWRSRCDLARRRPSILRAASLPLSAPTGNDDSGGDTPDDPAGRFHGRSPEEGARCGRVLRPLFSYGRAPPHHRTDVALVVRISAGVVPRVPGVSGGGLLGLRPGGVGRRAQIRRQGRAGPGHPRDDGPLPGLPPSELYRRDNWVDREPFRRDVRGRAPLPTVVGRLRRSFCAVRRPVDRRLGTGLGGYVRCSRR